MSDLIEDLPDPSPELSAPVSLTTLTDLTALSTEDLHALHSGCLAEIRRREELAEIPGRVAADARAFYAGGGAPELLVAAIAVGET